MRPHPLTVLWLLSCATLCAACGDDKPAPLPELRLVAPKVPAHLLECDAAPPELDPDDPKLTQRVLVRAYVVERAAGADCRARLREVKGLVTVDDTKDSSAPKR